MPSLKSIRKRIGSVKNTQKITKAMKMVSAAKLRRAQQRLMQSRQYGLVLEDMIGRIAAASGDSLSHPYLEGRAETNRALILVYTSDRGLCGGFNSNLLRRVDRYLREQGKNYKEIILQVIGRKGNDYFKARKIGVSKNWIGITDKLDYPFAVKLADEIAEQYTSGAVDEVIVAFNEFKSAISQEITFKKLFPINPKINQTNDVNVDMIWEPSKPELLNQLLPRFLAMQLYLANLESIAGELGARMSAMDNATSNASDMIGALTLQMNRARQAAITTELMDIVNGAESIK